MSGRSSLDVSSGYAIGSPGRSRDLHGLGFASALSEVGLPQNAIPLSRLLFNVGVELGQLAFIAVAAAVAVVVRRAVTFKPPRAAELIPPYAIGGVAMFWVIERVAGS